MSDFDWDDDDTDTSNDSTGMKELRKALRAESKSVTKKCPVN